MPRNVGWYNKDRSGPDEVWVPKTFPNGTRGYIFYGSQGTFDKYSVTEIRGYGLLGPNQSYSDVANMLEKEGATPGTYQMGLFVLLSRYQEYVP